MTEIYFSRAVCRGVFRLRAVRFAQDDREVLFTGGLSRGLSTARSAQDDRDLLFTGGFRAVRMEIQPFESLGAIPTVFEAGLRQIRNAVG